MTMVLGTRIKLIQDVDNYPDIYAPAGLTGTLVRIDSEGAYWVKLDKHFPSLDEWNNKLQIWDYSCQSPEYHPENYLQAI